MQLKFYWCSSCCLYNRIRGRQHRQLRSSILPRPRGTWKMCLRTNKPSHSEGSVEVSEGLPRRRPATQMVREDGQLNLPHSCWVCSRMPKAMLRCFQNNSIYLNIGICWKYSLGLNWIEIIIYQHINERINDILRIYKTNNSLFMSSL